MKNKPYVIGISGGSGSGKTSLIRLLRERFSEEELCIVSQDDYYKARHLQIEDQKGIKNFDRPKSILKNELIRDIKSLILGQSVSRLEYTFNNEKQDPQMIRFLPAPIIVVEGLFVFHFSKLQKYFDLKVFVQAKENLKVIRRIKRDRVERNYPIEDVLYRYEKHVLPAYEKYIKPYEAHADIIINNNQYFAKGLDVLSGFIRCKLDDCDQKHSVL